MLLTYLIVVPCCLLAASPLLLAQREQIRRIRTIRRTRTRTAK